jgi:hypothetical protein
MRIAGLVILCGLFLAGCDQAPTFDASSLPAYQKSYGDIRAKLSEADQRRLDLALVLIASGNGIDALQLSSSRRFDAPLSTLEGVANPLVYLDRLRPVVEGKTAAKVIKTVADGLDFVIDRAEKQSSDAKSQLAAVEIANPRYYWNRNKNYDAPEITFSVFNAGKMPISGITLNGTLTVRGRAAVSGGVHYNFSRVLQPGEQQSAKVTPNGVLANKDFENAFDAEFRLTVANVEDTGGRRLLMTDATVLDIMKKNREALRGG